MASIRTTNIGDTLTIKKIAQIYGHHPDGRFLTNHSNHAFSSYPKIDDPQHIVQVGTKLAVIDKGPAQTKYSQSYVTVVHNQHKFDIMASDLRRFCK